MINSEEITESEQLELYNKEQNDKLINRSVTNYIRCHKCFGSGAFMNANKPSICLSCFGKGYINLSDPMKERNNDYLESIGFIPRKKDNI